MALKPLDLKALNEATENVVTLAVGEVRVRRLSRLEYRLLLPPAPPGSAEWKPEEAVAKELEWLDGLPPAERVARRDELIEALYAAITRAIIEPVLTVDQVKRLGDDAFVIWAAVQEFWDASTKNGEPAEVAIATS